MFCIESLFAAEAVGGVIDLSGYDFDRGQTVSLSGEWAMFPREFVSGGADAAGAGLEPVFQRLPGYWNDAGTMESRGWATYSLTLLLPEDAVRQGTPLAFRFSDSISACSYWIDGELVFSSGLPGMSRETEIPVFKPGVHFFTPKSARVRLDIQASNFHYRVGGVWLVPVIGSAGMVADEWNRSTQTVLFLFGALMIMMVYQIAVFSYRHKELSALWFGLICLTISMRILVTGNCLLQQWVPDLHWEIARRFEFLPMAAAPVFFTLFIDELFPSLLNARVKKAIAIAGAFFACVIAVLPVEYSSRYVIVFQAYIVLCMFPLLHALCLAAVRKKSGSGWIIIGFLALAATVVNDILFSRMIFGFAYLLSFGLFAFISTQIILLARNFTLGFNRSERFALELEATNKSFSRFVPKQFLELLKRERIVDVALGDQVERTLTVLFSDIRQFTTISERMTPGENFAFLNAYLERIGPKVRENGGFIDKYVGDAIMALFPDSLDSAVRAGIEIQRELGCFNEAQRGTGKPEIEIGIGIHQDLMALGTIGEEGRMDTTVIADAVNLASRLEALSKLYGPGIIMLESLLDRLSDRSAFGYRSMGSCRIRGKREAFTLVQIYDGLCPGRREKIAANLPDWNLAMAAFEDGRYDEAKALFGAIVDRDSDDLAATYFYIKSSEDVAELV